MTFEISNINIISSDYGSTSADFWLTIEIDISEKNNHGAEVFSFHVVGIDRLKKLTENESRFGKGIIISTDYNEAEIKRMINNLIQNQSSWEELTSKLLQYSV